MAVRRATKTTFEKKSTTDSLPAPGTERNKSIRGMSGINFEMEESIDAHVVASASSSASAMGGSVGSPLGIAGGMSPPAIKVAPAGATGITFQPMNIDADDDAESDEEEHIHTPLAETIAVGGANTSHFGDEDEELLMDEENRYREYCHRRQEFLELHPIQDIEYRDGRCYGWVGGIFALPCAFVGDQFAKKTGGLMGCAYHYAGLALLCFLITIPLFFYENDWRWLTLGLDLFFVLVALIFYAVANKRRKTFIEPPTPPDPSLYPKLSMRARALNDAAIRQAARSVRTKKQSQSRLLANTLRNMDSALPDGASATFIPPPGHPPGGANGTLTRRKQSPGNDRPLDVEEFGSFRVQKSDSRVSSVKSGNLDTSMVVPNLTRQRSNASTAKSGQSNNPLSPTQTPETLHLGSAAGSGTPQFAGVGSPLSSFPQGGIQHDVTAEFVPGRDTEESRIEEGRAGVSEMEMLSEDSGFNFNMTAGSGRSLDSAHLEEGDSEDPFK